MHFREGLRLGAYGLRRYANKDLGIGFGVALLLHLALLGLNRITLTTQDEMPDTVAVGPVVFDAPQFGGSGGLRELDAPVGRTPEGEESARGKNVEGNEHLFRVVPKRSSPGKDKTTNNRDNPTTPATERQDPSQSADKTPARNGSDTGKSGGGSRAQGRPGAGGDRPAGGSGGSTIGVNGEGIGRCWQRSPSGMARGATVTEVGKVVVAFTVKPDGTVINIRKVSGSTTLFNQAKRLLAKARACPAAPGAPDVNVARLSYNFRFD